MKQNDNLSDKQTIEVIEDMEVIDDTKYINGNPNYIPCSHPNSLEQMTETEKKAYYALRGQKASLTRKANKEYKYAIRRCARALAEGVFDTLADGTQLTGAEILTLGAFERARTDTKAFETFTKLTGDAKESVEISAPSYEEFIKKTTIEW